MTIDNGGPAIDGISNGQTIFNDTSSAAGASILNFDATASNRDNGQTIFNGASTADHASISNDGARESHMAPAARQFSITHQLRPTLPSITWEAVTPPPLAAL